MSALKLGKIGKGRCTVDSKGNIVKCYIFALLYSPKQSQIWFAEDKEDKNYKEDEGDDEDDEEENEDEDREEDKHEDKEHGVDEINTAIVVHMLATYVLLVCCSHLLAPVLDGRPMAIFWNTPTFVRSAMSKYPQPTVSTHAAETTA